MRPLNRGQSRASETILEDVSGIYEDEVRSGTRWVREEN